MIAGRAVFLQCRWRMLPTPAYGLHGSIATCELASVQISPSLRFAFHTCVTIVCTTIV